MYKIGETAQVPIEEILSWTSVDGGGPGFVSKDGNVTYWDMTLSDKRADYHYDDVKASIATEGFIRPVTGTIRDGVPHYGDGHHRLAAAIDLGLKEIPVEFVHDDHTFLISDDSGDWELGREIPAENGRQEYGW